MSDAGSSAGRPIGPGWRLTFEALGLRLAWEPMPPHVAPPAWVTWWHIQREREEDLRAFFPSPAAVAAPALPLLNLATWAEGLEALSFSVRRLSRLAVLVAYGQAWRLVLLALLSSFGRRRRAVWAGLVLRWAARRSERARR